jgi:hypothetical protein
MIPRRSSSTAGSKRAKARAWLLNCPATVLAQVTAQQLASVSGLSLPNAARVLTEWRQRVADARTTFGDQAA